MSAPSERRPESPNEEGFLLLFAVVMIALVLIALAVAAPVVARDLRRDKEVESMHRAQQYVRAIRLYQRKFPNQYPASLEALEKSNNIRFLRKQYVDPLTGKADWRIIHVGENKTKVKGFFGEELGGLSSAGIGGGPVGQSAGLTPSGTTTVGQTNALASGFGGATVATPGSGTAGSTTGSSSTSGFGSGGVGLIMGVGSSRTGDSILTPNEQATYETWEFLYDPRIELLYKKGQLNGGLGSGTLGSQPASTFGQGLNGQSNAPSGTSGSGNGTSTPTKPQ